MKYKTWIIALSTLFLITGALWIQKPKILDNTDSKIVLEAPTSCAVGELVELDASKSDATSFTWKIVPETNNFRIIEQGRRALFCSGSPGTYLFIVAAAKRDSVDILVHSIKVKSKNVPVPSDIFVTMVRKWLPNNDPVILEKLARSFERVAASQHNDIDSLVAVTAASNKAILGDDLVAWTPFLKSFSDYLKNNLKEASLGKHVETWFRFAEALRQCKDELS